MKKDQLPPEYYDFFKNVSSLSSRTQQVLEENNTIEHGFFERDLFWKNQKKAVDRIMASLMVDIEDIKRRISEDVIFAEKLVGEFRNKVKDERFLSLQRSLDSWSLSEFVTKKRFLELLEKEI